MKKGTGAARGVPSCAPAPAGQYVCSESRHALPAPAEPNVSPIRPTETTYCPAGAGGSGHRASTNMLPLRGRGSGPRASTDILSRWGKGIGTSGFYQPAATPGQVGESVLSGTPNPTLLGRLGRPVSFTTARRYDRSDGTTLRRGADDAQPPGIRSAILLILPLCYCTFSFGKPL